MLRRLGRIVLWVTSGFIISSIFLVALYRYLPPPGTPLMLLRRVEGYGIHKSWIPFDEISPNLVRAVIASEDTGFCSHHGFDWSAIETAWDRYQIRRGRLLGASTISMQTAKNVFLWPSRDWLRKVFEAYFTVLIEVAWGKRRIIEIYLNVVEWGPGIYGAEAAAQHYFQKSAATLTTGEASVSLQCFQTRSSGHHSVQPGAFLPAAQQFIRTCRLSPRRCPHPVGCVDDFPRRFSFCRGRQSSALDLSGFGRLERSSRGGDGNCRIGKKDVLNRRDEAERTWRCATSTTVPTWRLARLSAE